MGKIFEIKDGSFFIDGEPFKLRSGAMHYFRIMPEYWEDRLIKLKLAGFNTVETVMAWNMHEPQPGAFNFTGMFDIIKFIETAQQVGLYVIIRPGPYTCAEWDFGGFPAWMLKDKNMQVRCNYAPYIDCVKRYYASFMPKMRERLIQNGGNIIAMQVENEYGSYGTDDAYMTAIKDIIKGHGIDCLLFTSDGDAPSMLTGNLKGVYKTLNFGSGCLNRFAVLDKSQPNMPRTCMEFWCGWFDHWGGKHHTRSYKSVLKNLEKFIDEDINFNIYMFHGGTNFDFWAGANCYSVYCTDTTSYDYCALLNEYGEPTPAYHAVRELLHKKSGEPLLPLPSAVPLQNIGTVQLTESAYVLDNLDVLADKHHTAHIESMEYFGQNYGWIMYSTIVKGPREGSTYHFEDVHDIAYLYVNGKLKKKYNRCKNKNFRHNDGFNYYIPAHKEDIKIDILVEAMGRVNYGPRMLDRKGVGNVCSNIQKILDWDVYCIPFSGLNNVKYTKTAPMTDKPIILRGRFKAQIGADCFVDTKGFKKGFIVVNGFNLGRYWSVGPQRTLYLPAPILKEDNEIIVVEQEGYANPSINITDKHYL